jgi:hypothetical protein
MIKKLLMIFALMFAMNVHAYEVVCVKPYFKHNGKFVHGYYRHTPKHCSGRR